MKSLLFSSFIPIVPIVYLMVESEDQAVDDEGVAGGEPLDQRLDDGQLVPQVGRHASSPRWLPGN